MFSNEVFFCNFEQKHAVNFMIMMYLLGLDFQNI